MPDNRRMQIAVAIPCYRVTRHVLDVIDAIGPEVSAIYAVDDACPDGSGDLIQAQCRDARVRVLRHAENQGVGAAMVTAYRAALADGMQVVVKIDGDGQMDPALVPKFIRPILLGQADYTKGNRFHRPESLGAMPRSRLLGNVGLSFITKLSTGYWRTMDPTNGYTAIHELALRELALEKLDPGFFFESDMLYRLSIIRAVVRDIPMSAVYEAELSNLKVLHAIPEFFFKHLQRFFRRYFYSYLLRDFNLGSLYSLLGATLTLLGLGAGGLQWLHGLGRDGTVSNGAVAFAALALILGVQFLIAFLHQDVSNVPATPLLADWEDPG